FDKTLPSQHTLCWYKKLHQGQCSIITQMCTGHICLNVYLTHFGVVDSGLCQCCHEPETVNHYLFTCKQFTAQ
ncbi:hypothetical protein DFH07DRAFT_688749, partial [Mycena maculata]